MQTAENIIISSLLILTLLYIRGLFGKKVSPAFIYSLWILAAVRVLWPGTIGESPLSIMNTGLWKAGQETVLRENVRQSREYKERKYQAYLEKITERQKAEAEKKETEPGRERQGAGPGDVPGKEAETQEVEIVFSYRNIPTFFGKAEFWAVRIRIAGMAVTAVIFIRQNLSLYSYLKRTRKKLREVSVGKRQIKVFTAGDKLLSPCLFGIFPSIYIPERCIGANTGREESGETDERLRFILEHELTHYRHGDFIWSLVRMLCLIAAWYNPLVWIGARLSLKDGELACDSGCLKRLGKEKRTAYGEALLDMIIPVKEQKGLFWHSTMTNTDGKFIKRRIEEIAENRKSSAAAVAAAMILAVLCTGIFFTGSDNGERMVRGEEERTTDTAGYR